MLRQLSYLDDRPQCPGCKRRALPLGQWSPGNRTYLCRTCSEANPMPDIYEVKPSTGSIRIRQDSTDGQRLVNLHMENVMHRLRRGCKLTMDDADPQRGLPCEAHDYPAQWDCRLCRGDLKRHTKWLIDGVPEHIANVRFRGHMRTYPRHTGRIDQLALPICQRCGQGHSRRYDHSNGYAAYCQHCDDLNSVEAFWRHKGIFGGGDVEAVLDRIEKANPGLFERGVLPDHWYQLMIEEQKEQS